MAKTPKTPNERCPGSGIKRHISDYCVLNGKANCPICDAPNIKISIPDRKMHGNVARFAVHKKNEQQLRLF